MDILQTYYVINSVKKADLKEENKLRRQAFYQIAPYWNNEKYGKLSLLSQIWRIPEIDDEYEKTIEYARVRKWDENVAKEYGLPLNWGERGN